MFFACITLCHAQVEHSELNKPYIVLNPEELSMPEIDSILKGNQNLAITVSKKNTIPKDFLKRYKAYKDSLVVISESEILSDLPNDLFLIHKKPDDMEVISITKTKLQDSMRFRFYEPDKLKIVKIEDDIALTDSLFFSIWKQSGRLPDFFEANRSSLKKLDSLVNCIFKLRYVYGVVETEDGQLIDGVRFKDYNDAVVNGHFSFPVLQGEGFPALIPYKAGYHFSPDIINSTPENYKNSKTFTAFPLDITYELSDHFVFDPDFENKMKENDKELLIHNVDIIEDKIHGKVGYFNNRSYIDTGVESKKTFRENFTIAAWVKPTALGFNNSILGKGNNFVVKLRNGFLTFTMAGVKDYISEVSVVPLNKWTHIALTHSKIDNKLFFYINGEMTEEVPLVSEYEASDFNVLIGSNLWEEFFKGYLADIKIWERELNGNEVLTLFENRALQNVGDMTNLIVVIFTVFLIVGLLLLRRHLLKKKKILSGSRERYKTPKVFTDGLSDNDGLERVLCFGKLRIFNSNNEDLAEKLSPLLKKIFVIVFLYSYQGRQKGISTKQLTEFLWPGMSVQKAKNTRGTNINNLRAVLNSCSEINLVFKDKSWCIELNDDCFCDYLTIQHYLSIFSNSSYTIKALEQELPGFLQILKGGRLFSNSSEPWLDPFIEKFSNQIIELCIEFTEILDVDKHSELLLDVTEVISIYDDLNEKAHQIKLLALIKQGKLSLAYKAHDNFEKLYYKIYKETYPTSFEAITSDQKLEKN
ncbi:LamG-like jellyroll fold domain-containing protein [Tamlana sp. 2201CG12-4]|uniref:LamG domain-containing protein n=1 Tax=Tamlana sp. 2201CG12-4 TaxID=3112582 RepID=UPI002DBB5C80|nr:LamG-like jellyroll fold domain-containing protein [Tamlana sp. 2201CG12-4]MEC3907037.1 LamG-like jellyroll fold domain-containing protein [Tamlana sp. 2201CG12-4]